MLIKHQPSHYLKMLYLESTSYWVPGARCAFESVGADHFVFGTDSPPLCVLKKEGVERSKKMGLAAEEKNKGYNENAKKLLKLWRAPLRYVCSDMPANKCGHDGRSF